jgi:hypothetical protein
MGRMVHARIDATTEEVLGRLRRQTGLSESELLRAGIRALAREHTTPRRVRVVGVGKFASGRSDLGTNKRLLDDFGTS